MLERDSSLESDTISLVATRSPAGGGSIGNRYVREAPLPGRASPAKRYPDKVLQVWRASVSPGYGKHRTRASHLEEA